MDNFLRYSSDWFFASSSSFFVAGDQTSVFSVGTKVRWSQLVNGNKVVKYGSVISSSYSSPRTTVTLDSESDAILNANIFEPCFSYGYSAQGMTPDIPTAQIDDGAVTNAKLADNAVTDVKIATDSVTASKIASNLDLTQKNLGIVGSATPVDSAVASGTVTSTANGVPTEDDTIIIGSTTYTFKDTFSSDPSTVANEVKIGADGEATLNNLRAALMASGTPGTEYSVGTVANTAVLVESAAAFDDPDYVLTITASAGGAAGNVDLSEDADNITVSGAALSGGVDGTPGKLGSLLSDGTSLYIATQDNVTEDAVWKKVDLSALS